MSRKQDHKTLEEKEVIRWQKYKETGDIQVRDSLALQYFPLVKYVAGKVVKDMPQDIEFDDLVGYGTFGLLDAIEKFDPTRGVKFKTYAVTRIGGAMYDGLRATDWFPRSIRQKAKEIESVIGSLENNLGRTATDKEIAEQLGVSIDKFYQIVAQMDRALISINDAWSLGDDNDKLSIAETIEGCKFLNPDVIFEKKEEERIVSCLIESLPDKEKKVLILYYYEGLVLKEIGEILSVTESRVSQLFLGLRRKLSSKIKSDIY